MVQDFQKFLAGLIGGGPDVPQAPQPTPPVSQPAPQPMPAAAPPPPQPMAQAQPQADPVALLAQVQQMLGQQAAPQPQQQAPPPAAAAGMAGGPGGQFGRGQALSPQMFAMLQEQQGAPERKDEEYTGTWVTVTWQNPGDQTTYYILMPEENATNLPEGANLVPNGEIVNDPERVKIAEEAGEKSPEGASTKTGLLSQMPEEVRVMFGDRTPPENLPESTITEEGMAEFEKAEVGTTAPPVNEQGQTQEEIDAQQRKGAQADVYQAVSMMQGRDEYLDEEGKKYPDLTTRKLRDTDPAKAATLENNGIFRVAVDEAVIRDEQGVRVVPLGTLTGDEEVITYGGDMPPPEDAGFGAGAILDALEVPQRKTQELVTQGVGFVEENTPDLAQEGLVGLLQSLPGGRTSYPAYAVWMLQNEDIVEEVMQNGYTDPESGREFEGERAVWERYQADRNLMERTADTVTTDPLNVLPTMGTPARSAGRIIASGADEAGTIAGTIRRGAGEVLEDVADVIDIPERTLGAVVDTTISGLRNVGEGVTNIPGIGPRIEQLFDDSRGTQRRNESQETSIQLEDVQTQRSAEAIPEPQPREVENQDGTIEMQQPDFSLSGGRTATRQDDGTWTITDREGNVEAEDLTWDAVQLRIPPPDAPAPGAAQVADQAAPGTGPAVRQSDEIVTAPDEAVPTPTAADVVQPQTVGPRVPSQPEAPVTQQQLPTDRPIDDLGRAPDQGQQAAQQRLGVDEPIEDLGQQEPIPFRQESEFWQTPTGKRTQEKIDTWPEFMRPQTAAERAEGVGRQGKGFGSRMVEVGRALAPEREEAWQRFITEANPIVQRFAKADSRRKANRQWGAVERMGKEGAEDGFDLKRSHEILIEADAMISTRKGSLARKFLDHFGADAELPTYQWKRWGTGENTHTALDTIEAAGGRYVPDTPLHEAVEVAIYHPDQRIANQALDDIRYRLGVHKRDGSLVEANGNIKINQNMPEELKKTEGGGNILNAIPKYRDSYLAFRRESDELGRANPDRLTVDEAERLSRLENVPEGQPAPTFDPEAPPQAARAAADVVDDPEGQRVFEEAYARSLEEEAAAADPRGAAAFERDLAASAFRDAGQPQPQALPYRTDRGDAMPMGAPGQRLGYSDVYGIGTQPDLIRTAGRNLSDGDRIVVDGTEYTVTRNRGRTVARSEAGDRIGVEMDRVYERPQAPQERPMALPYRSIMSGADEAIPMGGAGQAPTTTPERMTPEQRAARRQELVNDPGRIASEEAAVQEVRAGRRVQALDEHRKARDLPPAREVRTARTTNLTQGELYSMYVRGRTPSATQMKTLGREFENGESILERWDRYTREMIEAQGTRVNFAEAEDAAKLRVLNEWNIEFLNEKEKAQFDKLVERFKNDKHPETGEALKPYQVQIKAMERLGERAGRTKFGYWYDSFMSGLREVFLYNVLTGPRYIQTQMLGNTITAILTKHYDVVSDVIGPKSMMRATREMIEKNEYPPSLLEEVRMQYGLGGKRELVTGGSQVRDQTMATVGNEVRVKGIPILGKLQPLIANQGIKNGSAMYDTMPREGLWVHFMDNNMAVARANLREQMWATRPPGLAGITPKKARLEFDEQFDALPQRFSASDLRERFGIYDQRWADRHARDWQEALSKTDKAARDEVKRVFFDGGEKNIDLLAKRVIFFHYWMSRATPLYTEAIARNPVYLYNYLKMVDEMQDDDDLSGTDFVKWFSTPMGYATLIRPDAFFQTFGSFMEDSGYAPDGESWLGKQLREKRWFMLNPVVDSLINIAGFKGSTFAPDPLGANKFIQFGQAAIDGANAYLGTDIGGGDPTSNPSDTALRWLRHHASGALDFVPGIDQVPMADSMAYKENEVRSLVAEIAIERGMDLNDPIVQASMIDSESELYQEAMKRYALQDATDIALRILPVSAVLYPKSQLMSPKERTRAINEGKNPGGGYSDEALEMLEERDIIAAATEESRQLQTLEDEYYSLGTPEERGATSVYYSISFGSADQPIAVGGQYYGPETLQAMDSGQREMLADQWAEEAGVTELVESLREERAAFRDANPEYAEMSQWRNQLHDYPGGPTKWWEDTIVGNPNAERWYNDLPDDLRLRETILTSSGAYMAYKGIHESYFDPTPIETRDMSNVPYNPIGDDGSGGIGSGSGSSGEQAPKGPSKETISEQIAQYEADLAEYNAIAGQMLGGQEVNVELINPMARQAVEANLASIGVEKPRMGGYLYDYMQWADTRGMYEDTSVEAYLKWYRQQNPEEEEDDNAAAAD